MLATHCAVCHRPLLDAVSVETGIGPICRERHGWNEETSGRLGEDRDAANKIICSIAHPDVPECDIAAACAALRLMGFRKVADRIEYRGKDAPSDEKVVYMRPSTRGTGWYIKAPYKPSAVEAFRKLPTRKWDAEQKLTFVGREDRAALWALLQQHYTHHILVTADGTETQIPAPKAA